MFELARTGIFDNARHVALSSGTMTQMIHPRQAFVIGQLARLFFCQRVPLWFSGPLVSGSVWQQGRTVTLPLGVVSIRLLVVSSFTWVCQLSLNVAGWQVDIHSGRHSVRSATRPVYIISKSCPPQNNSIVGGVCGVSFLALTEFHRLSIYDN